MTTTVYHALTEKSSSLEPELYPLDWNTLSCLNDTMEEQFNKLQSLLSVLLSHDDVAGLEPKVTHHYLWLIEDQLKAAMVSHQQIMDTLTNQSVA